MKLFYKKSSPFISILVVILLFSIITLIYYFNLHNMPDAAMYKEDGSLIYDDAIYVHIPTEMQYAVSTTVGEVTPSIFRNSDWWANMLVCEVMVDDKKSDSIIAICVTKNEPIYYKKENCDIR